MIAASRIRPWSVPDDFDAGPAPGEVAPRPSAATPLPAGPTEADVAAARVAGREEGLRERACDAATQSARALQDIAHALARDAVTASTVADRAAAALAHVVARAVVAAFPSLEARFGPTEVAALVRVVLPGLAREPAVLVRLAAASFDAVDAELAGLPPSDRARIELVVDPALGDADVRLSWRDGGAARDGMAIRAAVLAALATIGEAPPSHTGDTS